MVDTGSRNSVILAACANLARYTQGTAMLDTAMLDTSAMTLHDLTAWDYLRLTLATGSGVRRNARRPINLSELASRTYEGRRLLVVNGDSLDGPEEIDSDGSSYLPSQVGGHEASVIRVVFPVVPSSPYELDMADYRRIQRERQVIERKYWRGFTPTASPFGGPERFRPFNPLPHFDGLGSSSLITYISR